MKLALLVYLYMQTVYKENCWFMKSLDNHIETGFAGVYAKNLQSKLLVCLWFKKAKVKLLVCIYAEQAIKYMLVW